MGLSEMRKADHGTRSGSGSGTEWIYGTHAASAALGNPKRRILRLVATRNAARDLGDRGADAEIADPRDLGRLLPEGAVHQGIACLAEPLAELDLEDLIAAAEAHPAPGPLVVLDQVTDPHNVGAILRSAAAFGALGLLVTERHAPGQTGVLAKAASGGLEHVPIVRVDNLARALETLGAAAFERIGLAEEAADDLAAVRPAPRVAILLGAEGKGLRRLTRDHCDRLVRLTTPGAIGSLNVSNAAAIALYELTRRAG